MPRRAAPYRPGDIVWYRSPAYGRVLRVRVSTGPHYDPVLGGPFYDADITDKYGVRPPFSAVWFRPEQVVTARRLSY